MSAANLAAEVATFAAAEREALIAKSVAALTAAFNEWHELMTAGNETGAIAIATKIDRYRMALKNLGVKVDA